MSLGLVHDPGLTPAALRVTGAGCSRWSLRSTRGMTTTAIAAPLLCSSTSHASAGSQHGADACRADTAHRHVHDHLDERGDGGDRAQRLSVVRSGRTGASRHGRAWRGRRVRHRPRTGHKARRHALRPDLPAGRTPAAAPAPRVRHRGATTSVVDDRSFRIRRVRRLREVGRPGADHARRRRLCAAGADSRADLGGQCVGSRGNLEPAGSQGPDRGRPQTGRAR